jgi:hypothetical protein
LYQFVIINIFFLICVIEEELEEVKTFILPKGFALPTLTTEEEEPEEIDLQEYIHKIMIEKKTKQEKIE